MSEHCHAPGGHIYDVVVLVSGGLDSAVLLDVVRAEYRNPIALHFSGFANALETKAAETLAATAGTHLYVIEFSSMLAALQTPRIDASGVGERAIFGATVLYTSALAFATAHRIRTLAIGLHKEDSAACVEYSAHYLRGLIACARQVGVDVELVMPLSMCTKADVVREGSGRRVDFASTWSCFLPVGDMHCGGCPGCFSRQRAFDVAGVLDPATYAPEATA